jgi:leucyl-tRNA synthetase
VQKELEQWFFRITAYAEELLKDLDRLSGWPEKSSRCSGTGSDAAKARSSISRSVGRDDLKVRIFTTRPDTAFGMTYAVLAPEHPLVDKLIADAGERAQVEAFRAEVAKQSDQERTAEDRPKRGLRLRCASTNPFNGAAIPLFIADYVLLSYGTGRDHGSARRRSARLGFRQALRTRHRRDR